MKMPGLEARLAGRLADQGAGWPGQEPREPTDGDRYGPA
jgi:hypothetical protein